MRTDEQLREAFDQFISKAKQELRQDVRMRHGGTATAIKFMMDTDPRDRQPEAERELQGALNTPTHGDDSYHIGYERGLRWCLERFEFED